MDRLPRSTRNRAAAALAGLLLAWISSEASAAATRYVFATFKGDGAANEKLSIYTSADGLNFSLLSDTGYGGPTGVLRDPSIMKHTDAAYYVAHTTQSWTTSSTSFAIARSTDLTTWTHVVTVDAQVTDVKDTWAPEWFKDTDGGIHLIVSIDTKDSAFRAFRFTATDDTLTKWAAPVPLGIGPNYIDTFVVKVSGTYHAFAKNETSKFIEHATASALSGPWTWVGTGDWAGWGSGKEGPALFQIDSGAWRIFMDRYSTGGYLYSTASSMDSWSATAVVPGGLSGVVRHGTVLREERLDAGVTEAGVRDATLDRDFPDRVSGAGGTTGIAGGGATAGGGTTGSAGAGGGGTGREGGAGNGGSTGLGGSAGGSAGNPISASGGSDGTGSTTSLVDRKEESTPPASASGCSCRIQRPRASTVFVGLHLIGLLVLKGVRSAKRTLRRPR